MSDKLGMVYLTGAGCGGAELLTLRARELISACDCLVYDDLIDEGILALAPPEAELVHVGKRAGRHSMRQEEINRVLVECAGRFAKVVRLKGGDPFVFGRGGEEFLALNFHVVTAHTAGDGLPEDIDELAKLGGTLVFLMGLGRLEQLAAALIGAGMDPATPTAVVSGGNAKKPACVRAPILDIAARTREAGVEAPAVIVVGPAAALELRSPGAGPLSGVRVALTGTESFQERLRARLAPLGAELRSAARTRLLPLDFELSPDELHGRGGWLAFTSPNGVELALDRLFERGLDLRRLGGWRIAAIGPATAGALARRGLRADLVPDAHSSAALAAALAPRLRPDETLLLLRSARGAAVLAGLPGARDIAVYDTRTSVSPLPCDYLVLGSAGGAADFFAAEPEPPGTAVCVGPVTAAAVPPGVRKLVSRGTSADGIVSAILEDVSLHN